MSWLKENWFKLTIALSILAAAFSCIYYFAVYLPDQNTAAERAKLHEHCKDIVKASWFTEEMRQKCRDNAESMIFDSSF